VEGHVKKVMLTRAMGWGSIGGLAGTLVMDVFVIGVLSAIGWPTGLMFSFIGDTAAGFFSLAGIDLSGGIPLGVVVQYMVGLALGIAFAATMSRMETFRRASLKKAALFGILLIEIVSLPIAATAPIINNMAASDTIQWLSLSLLAHPFYSAVLGAVTRYGQRYVIVSPPLPGLPQSQAQ
jgi:hypothetical protein